jgi:ATP synthase protein I
MSSMKELGRYGTVGLDLIVSIAFGYYGGRWVDARVGAHGWITMVGVVFGVAAGFRFLWRAAQKMQGDVEREDAERKSQGKSQWK